VLADIPMQYFFNPVFATLVLLITSTSNLFAEAAAVLPPPKKEPNTRLEVGLRLGGAWTASKDSTIVDTGDSGGNGTVGAALHFFPIQQLAIDSGIRHRWVGIGYGSSISFQEWQIPVTIAYHVPTGADTHFFLGGGITSLLPTSGTVYRTLGGSANVKIPASDLNSGLSYLLMVGVHGKAFGSGYYRIEVGFEYAERSLRIFTRDIFVGFELGINVFSI
jgi:hypothetical protein